MEKHSKNDYVYVILDDSGVVVAHILNGDDASAFSEYGVKYTRMLFNRNNAEGKSAPAVGSKYVA